VVDVHIGLGDLAPAVIQAHGAGLLAQVGVLAAGHLVAIDVGGAGADIGLEGGIEAAHALPVAGEPLQGVQVQARVPVATGQGGGDGAEVGLGGEPAQGVQGAIDGVAAGLDGGQDRGGGDAAGVMGVEMDRQADFLLERQHQLPGGAGLTDAGHVLDAQDVGAGLFELFGEIHVVLEVVLGTRRIEQVTRVADGRLAEGAGLDDGVHGHPHIVHPVQGVEDPEEVDALPAACWTK
jgi:hypothetical protein